MESVKEEKYVGDMITGDGRHTKNVDARRSKGMGIISEIVSILDGLYLGAHYFTTALMMRQCMLLSVLLFNSETWLRLTQRDLAKLERIDRLFLRRIFHVPNSTPIPFLYLETGCVPIRYVMKMKRVMFLHYILTRREDALILRAFKAQLRKPAKGDWCIVVKEDLQALGMGHFTFDDIRNLTKEALHSLLKTKIRETAFSDLLFDKANCSKLKLLKYTRLEFQPYLASESNLTNKLKRLLFRWRSRTINVRQNWGKKRCEVSTKIYDDTQYHLLTCEKLSLPKPWNIESVMAAIRQRELLLEEENK